jgi:methyl-accepting chemotaxis protein
MQRFFADLSVQVKILASIGIAALVALAVGLVGLLALSRSSDSANLIYRDNVGSIRTIGRIDAAAAQTRVDLADQAISDKEETRSTFAATFATDVQTFNAALAQYKTVTQAGEPTVIADLESSWQKYAEIAQTKQIPNGERHDLLSWEAVRDAEVTPLFATIEQDIATLTTAETAAAARNAAAARSRYGSSRLQSIVLLTGGLILAMALGLVVARAIVRALARVKDVCDALAAGDLTLTTGLTSHDEPGRMGEALDTAMVRLRSTVSTIDGSAHALAGASEQMSSVAGQMATSAETTSSQAETVSAAAEQISRSVETVSAGSEEMGASIREISENATEAARVAGEAVSITATTSTTMSKLGESSAEIGNVIKMITSIAQQTNLLALNATIEAARAGDAGKGFAVVASEVKDLAQETARATEDISRRVQAIQADTIGAVAAIEEISDVIARISDFQTTIASAVEEQTATTAEMNRNVSEAAGGSSAIAQNITGVAEAARSTSQGVNETQQATKDLARLSAELSGLVANFRY